jgi:DNA polymerase-1
MPRSSAPRPKAPAWDAALLDTYSLFFRAFHALPRMNTSSGEPTSALYGFSALVLKILREQRPRTLSFALDAPTRTFRSERYPDYKAGRAKLAPELGVQLGRLPELIAAFGVPALCAPGFEADDVLATVALRLNAGGARVLIVSGDRDLLKLASDSVNVWFVGARGKDATLFDAAAVTARFGVPPEKLATWFALVGDNSDHLLGVPGIGPTTATKLVLEHGSVAALLENLERVTPDRTREAIAGAAERLRMNEELATLRLDVPLAEETLAGPMTGEGYAKLGEYFSALEFKSLLPRVEALARSGE